MFSKDAPKIRADILNSIPLTPPIVSKIHNHSSPINSSVSCSSVDKTGDFFECYCFLSFDVFNSFQLMFQIKAISSLNPIFPFLILIIKPIQVHFPLRKLLEKCHLLKHGDGHLLIGNKQVLLNRHSVKIMR